MIPVLVVPIINRYDLLERLIDSIDFPIGKIVLIDNNPDSEFVLKTNDFVKSQFHLKMPSNLGVSSSWNLGIKSTPFANYWLIANSDAWFPNGSLRMFELNSNQDRVILCGSKEPWCAFTIGSRVVERVGLFDESIHPAYFEDDDYFRRLTHHEIHLRQSEILVHHDNSSTLESSGAFKLRNNQTFLSNMSYFENKVKNGDFSAGSWTLKRRIENSWDRE